MENAHINPTIEMDNALSTPCPSPECDCPGCIEEYAIHCMRCGQAIGDLRGQELLGEETEDGPECHRCVALRAWLYGADQEAKDDAKREVCNG